MATPSIAANAYASLAKLTDPSGLTKGAGEASGGQASARSSRMRSQR